MTRIEAILEKFSEAVAHLQHEAKQCRWHPGDREPESPERIARCAARKQQLLQEAIAAGVLPREVGEDDE